MRVLAAEANILVLCIDKADIHFLLQIRMLVPEEIGKVHLVLCSSTQTLLDEKAPSSPQRVN